MLDLQPTRGNKRQAGIDLAIPAPVDDPGLVSIRGQLVRRGPRQQDGLANLKSGTAVIRGAEHLVIREYAFIRPFPSRSSLRLG